MEAEIKVTGLELNPFPVSVLLFIGEDQWIKYCDEAKVIDRTWLDQNSQAEVSAEGGDIIVKFRADIDPIENIDTISHEATHVVQGLWSAVSETTPGCEASAYYLGHITKWIFTKIREYQCQSSSLPTTDSSAQASSSES